MALKLHIWLEDEPLSPDMEMDINFDITMKLGLSLEEARELVLDLAQEALDRKKVPGQTFAQAIKESMDELSRQFRLRPSQ